MAGVDGSGDTVKAKSMAAELDAAGKKEGPQRRAKRGDAYKNKDEQKEDIQNLGKFQKMAVYRPNVEKKGRQEEDAGKKDGAEGKDLNDTTEEEKKVAEKKKKEKRQGRKRNFRGNLNLLCKANKEAAKLAMLGKKPRGHHKKKKRKRVKKKAVGQNKQSAWQKLMTSIFGTRTQEAVTLMDEKTKAIAKSLNLSQHHLKKMKMNFDEIDVDGSGNIDIEEMFEFLDEKRSPFTDAVFALVDMDPSQSVDYEEFLRICCIYCIYTEEDILRFCFDCFDKDGSGTIDEAEYIVLCQTINAASPPFGGNFQKALEQFDVNDDGLIDFGEFTQLHRRYPMILFPAFRLQDAMQALSFGEDDWRKIHANINAQRELLEYRELHDGENPPISCAKRVCQLFCPCIFPSVGKISPAIVAEFSNH